MPEVCGVNGFVQLGSGEPIVMGFRIPGLLGQLNHLDILSERAGGKTYAVRNESKIVQYLAVQKDRKIVSQYFKCWFCLLYFGVSVTVCEEKKTGLGCQPLESTSASRPPLPSNPGHGPCQQTLPLSRAVWQILGKNPLDWWCDVFSLARRWSSSLAFADRCGLNGPAPQPSAVSLIPKVQIPRGETHLWPMRRKACLGGHIFLGEAFAMYNWREENWKGVKCITSFHLRHSKRGKQFASIFWLSRLWPGLGAVKVWQNTSHPGDPALPLTPGKRSQQVSLKIAPWQRGCWVQVFFTAGLTPTKNNLHTDGSWQVVNLSNHLDVACISSLTYCVCICVYIVYIYIYTSSPWSLAVAVPICHGSLRLDHEHYRWSHQQGQPLASGDLRAKGCFSGTGFHQERVQTEWG